MAAEATPLPRLETTPPVMNMYLVIGFRFGAGPAGLMVSNLYAKPRNGVCRLVFRVLLGRKGQGVGWKGTFGRGPMGFLLGSGHFSLIGRGA